MGSSMARFTEAVYRIDTWRYLHCIAYMLLDRESDLNHQPYVGKKPRNIKAKWRSRGLWATGRQDQGQLYSVTLNLPSATSYRVAAIPVACAVYRSLWFPLTNYYTAMPLNTSKIPPTRLLDQGQPSSTFQASCTGVE